MSVFAGVDAQWFLEQTAKEALDSASSRPVPPGEVLVVVRWANRRAPAIVQWAHRSLSESRVPTLYPDTDRLKPTNPQTSIPSRMSLAAHCIRAYAVAHPGERAAATRSQPSLSLVP